MGVGAFGLSPAQVQPEHLLRLVQVVVGGHDKAEDKEVDVVRLQQWWGRGECVSVCVCVCK